MDHWISVYETDQLYRAELTKDILNNEEVDAVILNRKDSSYHEDIDSKKENEKGNGVYKNTSGQYDNEHESADSSFDKIIHNGLILRFLLLFPCLPEEP